MSDKVKKQISQVEQAEITLEMIEFKTLLRIRGISGKNMAKSIGLSYGGYRSATKDKAVRVPVWVRSFMLGCNLSERSISVPQEFSGASRSDLVAGLLQGAVDSEKNRVLRTDDGEDVRDDVWIVDLPKEDIPVARIQKITEMSAPIEKKSWKDKLFEQKSNDKK